MEEANWLLLASVESLIKSTPQTHPKTDTKTQPWVRLEFKFQGSGFGVEGLGFRV